MKRPTEIVIQQVREDLENESYLPNRLAKLGVSAVLAAKLAAYPFFSQILTTLLSISSSRVEERLLEIAAELEAQQERIADRLKDSSFYESEEFQTLLALVLERIYATHEKEKLKMLGDALANSALPEYRYQEKEAFIRILRDLSLHDLKTLNDDRLKGWRPVTNRIEFTPEVLSSLSRLNGMGLVVEQFHRPPSGNTGSDRLDAKISIRELFSQPVRRAFLVSPFGERFLDFVRDSGSDTGELLQRRVHRYGFSLAKPHPEWKSRPPVVVLEPEIFSDVSQPAHIHSPKKAEEWEVVTPAIRPATELWNALKQAKSPADIEKATRKIRPWMYEEFEPRQRCLPGSPAVEYPDALNQYAKEFLVGKQLASYAKTDRPRSDDKRVNHLAKVLAGARFDLAPITAIKRLSSSTWSSFWPEDARKLLVEAKLGSLKQNVKKGKV